MTSGAMRKPDGCLPGIHAIKPIRAKMASDQLWSARQQKPKETKCL